MLLQLYLEDEVWTQFGIESEQVNLTPDQITPELEHDLQVLSRMQQDVLQQLYEEDPPYYSDDDL